MVVRRYLITGCSGGGKSSLIDALAASGFATMPEAGRRIVQEQLATGGNAIPWEDMDSFIERLSAASIEHFDRANGFNQTVFFDRGFIEPLAHWRSRDSQAFLTLNDRIGSRRYCVPVFVAPPWPELFVSDNERQHDFSEAVREYHSICEMLNVLHYRQIEIPKLPVENRAEFVVNQIDIAQKSVQ